MVHGCRDKRKSFRGTQSDSHISLETVVYVCYDKVESVGIAYLIDMIPPEARGFGYEAGCTDHSTEQKFHIVSIDRSDGVYRSIVAGNTGEV